MNESTDFIVVGSGIAGLHAALTLAHFGKVILMSKQTILDSSTYYAQGGIAAATKEQDSFQSHIEDTLIAGAYHNNKNAVSLLISKGPHVIADLIKLGVPFDKEINNQFSSSLEAGHSYPRILHATDFTGRVVAKTLVKRVSEEKNITVWENTFAIDLIIWNNQCYGVYVAKDKKITTIFSRGTVLTTGGVGHVYKWTTNPVVVTGDGIAMAYRAGAKLKDLEFVQFHPTALKENSSPLFLLSEALRGEGAVLRDHQGEQFMKEFHPREELAPRDVVARAIAKKQREGTVFLDIRDKGKKFLRKRFPNIYEQLEKKGFNLANDLIPITPAEHFLCGGVDTDSFGRTSIGYLFAYGEVAATGVHGANRLASNSLLEGFAYSGQVGYCIEDLPREVRKVPTQSYCYVNSGVDSSIRKKVQKLMWEHLGIERSRDGLAYALRELEKIERELGDKLEGSVRDWELKNMTQVGMLITKFALERRESLGTHYLIG